MAGDWIKIRTNLADDPRVMAMADFLEVEDITILGALLVFWSWADSHTEDGNVRNLSASRADKIATLSGFSSSMSHVGWAKIDSKSQIFTIVNYSDHNGASAKRRSSEAKRKADSRSKSKGAAKCPKSVRIKSGQHAELEKRREEKSITLINKSKSSQPDLDELPFPSDSFSQAWNEWKQHRKEIKKKLTPSTTKGQLAKLAKLNELDAIITIRNSIDNGWAGLFPDKLNGAAMGGTNQGGSRRGADAGAGIDMPRL